MRICVINDNGNVAKTTCTNYLLSPRLPGCEVVYVESKNSIPGRVENSRQIEATPEEFEPLIEDLHKNRLSHHIVVDFGSTDAKTVRNLIVEVDGSQNAFDLFVVPHSPDGKEDDTIATINFLHELGIPSEKIKMVFNIIPMGKKVNLLFPDIFSDHSEKRQFTLDPSIVIKKSGLYKRIKGTDMTIEGLATDTTDYDAKITSAFEEDPAKNDAIITYYTQMIVNTGLARTLVSEFDHAFKWLVNGINDGVSKQQTGKKKGG